MLVPMKGLLDTAQQGGYAVGSFDVVNLETCRAVLDQAVELRSPVIIAIPEHFGALCGFEELVAGVSRLAAPLPIPVATLLDHGRTYESCLRALRAGLTSVMLDCSVLPLAENIANVREVVKAAHALGVSVEGEVGHVGRGIVASEEALDHTRFTEVGEAVEFVRATGVDALAVAVGTAHGLYKGEPKIEFELLDRLTAAVPVPLVLHGGSSTGDERLRGAVEHGIRKVNIFTDMSVQAVANMQQLLAEEPRATVLNLFGVSKQAFADVSGHYMHLFGSVGRA
ncbi:MAG: class II fructose-bisphosphate aldolase [Chloroflexi bacterium]|nr:class II fructose-bisphosphate aldolase [Chloroflexota bacterium]MCL5109742.1 class II fructose-bisphosphate aldolase [Chloroflexota bacterium]